MLLPDIYTPKTLSGMHFRDPHWRLTISGCAPRRKMDPPYHSPQYVGWILHSRLFRAGLPPSCFYRKLRPQTQGTPKGQQSGLLEV